MIDAVTPEVGIPAMIGAIRSKLLRLGLIEHYHETISCRHREAGRFTPNLGFRNTEHINVNLTEA